MPFYGQILTALQRLPTARRLSHRALNARLSTSPGSAAGLRAASQRVVPTAAPHRHPRCLFDQLWRFITPGLKPNEKRYAVPFIVATVGLFAAGRGLAYLIFPHALRC